MKDYVRNEQAKRDALAASYDQWYVETKGALFDSRERAAFVDAMAGIPEARTLDLGCGTGRIAAALIATGARLVGSDLSLESLHHFRVNLGAPGVAADAGWGLPFRAGAVEAITSCGVFSRMEPPEVEKAMAECRRILSPGGRLVFNVYNDQYWRSAHLRTRQARPEEARFFSVGNVTRLAQNCGFAVESVSHFKALPFRRLRAEVWLALDRAVCALPFMGARAAAFTLYSLRTT